MSGVEAFKLAETAGSVNKPIMASQPASGQVLLTPLCSASHIILRLSSLVSCRSLRRRKLLSTDTDHDPKKGRQEKGGLCPSSGSDAADLERAIQLSKVEQQRRISLDLMEEEEEMMRTAIENSLKDTSHSPEPKEPPATMQVARKFLLSDVDKALRLASIQLLGGGNDWAPSAVPTYTTDDIAQHVSLSTPPGNLV